MVFLLFCGLTAQGGVWFGASAFEGFVLEVAVLTLQFRVAVLRLGCSRILGLV